MLSSRGIGALSLPARGREPIVSTVGDPTDPAWRGLMRTAQTDRENRFKDLVDLWWLARGREALVLRGSVSWIDGYRDLVFAILLKTWRKRPRVLMTDATWEPTSRKLAARFPFLAPALPSIARIAIRAIDGPHMTYAVLSTEEREVFSRTWGVPVEQVVFTPFPMTLEPDELATPVQDGGFLFAGGNSLRDYDLLEQAVAGTGVPVRVAASWSPSQAGSTIVASGTTHAEFVELMARCRAMVVPLAPSVRSAGQQTYLNAMALGKPVIVTDAMGVRDYIEDGITGVVVEPDAEALGAAIEHVMDPANGARYEQMGRRARADVLDRFSRGGYYARLLDAARADRHLTE